MPDAYMTRPQELAKNPDTIQHFELIASVARTEDQRRDIFLGIWTFWNAEHALDDVIDSGKLTKEEAEDLLRDCWDMVQAALERPGTDAARLWFRDVFIADVEQAGFSENDARLAVEAIDQFAANLENNPFYQQHAQQHLALFNMILMRAIAGDEMAASENAARRALAPAVRCGDIDFLVHAAFIAGGWDWARKITSARDYDTAD